MITLPAVPAPGGVYDVTIDGVPYKARYSYIRRLDAWYADLLTSSGVPLYTGERMLPGFTLWDAARDGAPTGRFFVVDTTQANPDRVSREAFGDPIVVVYMTAAEVAANPATPPEPPPTVVITS